MLAYIQILSHSLEKLSVYMLLTHILHKCLKMFQQVFLYRYLFNEYLSKCILILLIKL